MIVLKALRKDYPSGTSAVSEVDLEVREGELLALLGESGSGKTTTLKMINGLIARTSGDIWLDGEHIDTLDPVQLRRKIGYVIQGVGLFPHFTVGENIAVVPGLLRWPREQIRARVDEMLALVELDPDTYRSRFPQALSGGQRQRVGVARALAARPRILLMDEPFGALDPITRAGLQDELKRIHGSLGLTIVLVTHDMAEALLLADRIAVMKDGAILQVDTPHALMTRPAHDYVRELVELPKQRADRLESLGTPDA